jgi:hypothetical protein
LQEKYADIKHLALSIVMCASLCWSPDTAMADDGAPVEVVDKPTKTIAYTDPAITFVGRWLDKGNAM